MDSQQVLQAVRDGVMAQIPTPTAIEERSSRIANVFRSFLSRFRSVYRYPLKQILRRLVHSDSFWRDGLSIAWAPTSKSGVQMVGPSVPQKLTNQDIFRYKLPSMASQFDDDLFRFVTAQKGSNAGSTTSPEVVSGVDQTSLLAGTFHTPFSFHTEQCTHSYTQSYTRTHKPPSHIKLLMNPINTSSHTPLYTSHTACRHTLSTPLSLTHPNNLHHHPSS